MSTNSPFIVGIGGTTRPNSLSERYLQIALRAAEESGARTVMLGADALHIPLYEYGQELQAPARDLVDQLRRADGVILVSPGYHGTVSGLMKNALDYVEELRNDDRPYFSGRAVGCMAVAGGWQAAVSTMSSLRGIVHALRGWPTPLGVAINSGEVILTEDGDCESQLINSQIQTMAKQVLDFARLSTH
jgi:FMN reductase